MTNSGRTKKQKSLALDLLFPGQSESGVLVSNNKVKSRLHAGLGQSPGGQGPVVVT